MLKFVRPKTDLWPVNFDPGHEWVDVDREFVNSFEPRDPGFKSCFSEWGLNRIAESDAASWDYDVCWETEKVNSVSVLGVSGLGWYSFYDEPNAIAAGPSAGKCCYHATCDDIKSCLREAKAGRRYSLIWNNCRHGAATVLESCCLRKGKELGASACR